MSSRSIKRRIIRRWLAQGFARVAKDGKLPNKSQLDLLVKDYKVFRAEGIDAVRPAGQLYLEWIIEEANDGNAEWEEQTSK